MPDIILSSGYLGFARHIGFLKALEKNKISVDAICGTSLVPLLVLFMPQACH
ncbi:MAG: putative acylesterase/phospholipase RssA [Francisellaceae bacterium]|jgi:predicted acylesterase/phospholipase RssA